MTRTFFLCFSLSSCVRRALTTCITLISVKPDEVDRGDSPSTHPMALFRTWRLLSQQSDFQLHLEMKRVQRVGSWSLLNTYR